MKEIKEEEWIQPFSPDFIIENKKEFIPAEMIKAVNILLAERYSGDSAVIKQGEIIEKFLSIVGEKFKRKDIFDKHFLHFECVFRNVGWYVEFDKPGYNENYQPYYSFRKKR